MASEQEWTHLTSVLASRYPDDWVGRLMSYRNGTNTDVLRWNAIGGEVYVPKPKPPRAAPGPNTRAAKIWRLFKSGVSREALCERFGAANVSAALIANGVRLRAAKANP